ncbi:hypothetical protein cgR_6023 [Corynebacterium glutamicum R]|uniref:Uncharacterized protein n=1 Tax=Corynebacterium glutamicum (strain R) TaxID=340322 RepID=A0AB72VFH0_CORGB|nr:hypothetical protein cgR_6023 [Corynebacterium glutamicum R]
MGSLWVRGSQTPRESDSGAGVLENVRIEPRSTALDELLV